VDELKFNKGFEMHMVEFYECIARLSEIASMPPVNVAEEDYEDWPYKRRFELPLHIKIEGFLKRVIKFAKIGKQTMESYQKGNIESLFSPHYVLEDTCIFFKKKDKQNK